MSITRRRFLKTSIVSAGTLTALGPLPLRAAEVVPGRGDAFPQGVASGDPKETTVILWTRVVGRTPGTDVALRLLVATDRQFRPNTLLVDTLVTAFAEHDGCVRVKVTGLVPSTTYYYRFFAVGERRLSPVGRTKTAAAADDRRPIRFALANCQDFIGRYYNSYLPLLTAEADDLDFVLHVGDFIYETTGDPQFQSPKGQRDITFTDEAGAIRLGSDDTPYFAARSLANYRQLYQTYRSDRVLKEVLARFPLIAVWDDHEYSDDRWQTTATYFDGRQAEADLERLHNAERAWLEYMPIDDGEEGGGPADDILATDDSRLWPNTRIFRSLRFGANLDLCLLDYRSFRPDHAIAEDAFPGMVVAGEAEVAAKYAERGLDFAADRDAFAPYIAWDAIPPNSRATLIAAFAAEYEASGYAGPLSFEARAREALTGNLSIPYLNRRLPSAEQLPFTPATPRGLSFEMIGKASLFASFGSRYALNSKWFDLFSAFRGLDDENAYGDAQEEFLKRSLTQASARWTFIASSVSHTTMRLDFTQDFTQNPVYAELSPAVQTLLKLLKVLLPSTPYGPRILLNADQWDGLPSRRAALLDLYRAKGNVILLAGDIHSSWVTDHSLEQKPLYEFTAPAISSATFADLILDQIAALAGGAIPAPVLKSLAGDLTRALDAFLFERLPVSAFLPSLRQDLRYINVGDNGIVVFTVDSELVEATYWLLPESEVAKNYYWRPEKGLAKFRRHRFLVGEEGLVDLPEEAAQGARGG
jgi:alkaline phosphatase D